MRILIGLVLIVAPWAYWIYECLPVVRNPQSFKAEEAVLAKIWLVMCIVLSIAGVTLNAWLRRKLR